MILAALLPSFAAVLLSVPDPAGDTRGDGSYVLPSALVGGVERALDLRELRAERAANRLRVVVGLGGQGNPWNAPGGLSAAVVDVFVKTGLGGARELGETGFSAPAGTGWQRHYQLGGFGVRAWSADASGNVTALPEPGTLTVRGSELVLDTNLAAGRYSYWVTSSVYSPLTASGVLSPRVSGGPETLVSGRAGQPAPVDVLTSGDQARAYVSRVLPENGELRDRRPLLLLVLAAVGLLIAVIATFRAWRR